METILLTCALLGPITNGGQLAESDTRTNHGEIQQLRMQLQKEDPVARARAVTSIIKLKSGAKALVPDLRKLLQRIGKEKDQRKIPLGRLPVLYLQVVYALSSIGPEAAPAIPDMLEAMKVLGRRKEQGARRIGALIAAIGPEAVTKLMPSLDDPDVDVRRTALHALELLGPKAKAAVPALIHSLDVRRNRNLDAARALAKIGSAALPHIEKALESPKGPVRDGALMALVHLGEKGKSALPLVLKQFKQPGQSVYFRLYTIGFLEKVGTGGKEVASELQLLMKDDMFANYRMRIAGILWRDTKDPERIMAAIRAELKPSVKHKAPRRACELVMLMGASAKEAIPELTAIVRKIPSGRNESIVRQRAARALGRIGPEAETAVPSLLRYVRNCPKPEGRTDEREAGVFALSQIGPAAATALPDFIDATRSPSFSVRRWAITGLGAIGPKYADKTVPLLIELLKSKDTRQHAAWALALIGPKAKPACNHLLLHFNEGGAIPNRSEVSCSVALWRIEGRHRAYAAVFRRAFKQQFPTVVFKALELLGPEAKEFIPEMKERLDSWTPSARHSALRLIERLEKLDK